MFEFVRRPPSTVGDLAAALTVPMAELVDSGMFTMGTVMAFDRGLSAHYAWDMHHENPVTTAEALARRRLTEWSARFDADRRPACEAELRAAHGPAVEVAGRHRHGPFFLTALDPGGPPPVPAAPPTPLDPGGPPPVPASPDAPFSLQWFAATPDWALARPDPAARIRAVQRFVAGEPADLPPGVALDAGRLRFRPPMPARDLVHALGVGGAIAVTVDAHQSAWELAAPDGGDLRRGGRRIRATLSGRAGGGLVPGVVVPGGRAAFLGDADTVVSCGFG